MSLLLDLKIIIKTVKVVLLSEEIYSGKYRDKVLEMNKKIKYNIKQQN